MSVSSGSTSQDKIGQRAAALARRDALSEGERRDAAIAIAERPFPLALGKGQVVCGYAAIRSEFDPFPLMRKLSSEGAEFALPVIGERNAPLVVKRWRFDEPLVPGPFGIGEPSIDAETISPDIVLVPLAAFDRAGHRIGYGGGYYDRTLAALRSERKVLAVGLAFSVQEVDAVIASGHDQRLDFVLTEREAIDMRSS